MTAVEVLEGLTLGPLQVFHALMTASRLGVGGLRDHHGLTERFDLLHLIKVRGQVEMVFRQAFTQVEPSAKRRNEGTGLGLHLSGKLAELLGGRGVYTAVEFLRATRVSFAEYRRLWAEAAAHIRTRRAADAPYPAERAATWYVSYGGVSARARELQRVLSWFATDPLPVDVLRGVLDPLTLEPLPELNRFAAIPRRMIDNQLTFARGVQAATRDWMTPDQRDASLGEAVRILEQAVADLPASGTDRELRLAPLRPHLQAVLAHSEGRTDARRLLLRLTPDPVLEAARAALERFRERRDAERLRKELAAIAGADADDPRVLALRLVRGLATGPLDVAALERFLTDVRSEGMSTDPLERANADPVATTPDTQDAWGDTHAPRFRPGTELPGRDGWELRTLLGIGRSGEVWLAQHRMSLDRMAVRFGRSWSGSGWPRDAAGALGRLAAIRPHPGLVPLRDFRIDGETPWLGFEYVDGRNLANRIESWSPLPPAERAARATATIRELVGIVAHLHEEGVVHRDLKPTNILVDARSGRLRVTDFGISGLSQWADRSAEHAVTPRGQRHASFLRGSHTPLYASPEQREGVLPHPRDDVFALGVIAYQIVTLNHHAAPGADLRDDFADAGAGAELTELVARCCAVRPDRRPNSAAEVLALLPTPAVAAPVTLALPPSAPPAGDIIGISFRRSDRPGAAARLYHALTDHFGRESVEMDVDSLAGGANLRDAIAGRIRRCRVLLVVIGPGWLDVRGEDGGRRIDDPDDFVRLEVSAAITAGTVIIPVLVNGAPVPPAEGLPEELRPLLDRQAVRIRSDPDSHADMRRLIQDIERGRTTE